MLLNQFLLLAAVLFCIGVYGVLVRKNAMLVLMSVELILNAARKAVVALPKSMARTTPSRPPPSPTARWSWPVRPADRLARFPASTERVVKKHAGMPVVIGSGATPDTIADLLEVADAAIVVPAASDGTTSTPHVEGFHEIYHHLICQRLLDRVRADA